MNYQQFISPDTQFYQLAEPFPLESGEVLSDVQVAYRTWGKLSSMRDNAVLVCHALTGSADVDRWWEPLLGASRSLDVDRDFIICSNILGSCYGTTGATSINSNTGKPYGAAFPSITIRDMVRLQAILLQALNVRSLKLVIGGSLGGMQVLEWAVLYPELVNAIAIIAAPGRHSAWCIGISEAQRQAIYADPHWQNGDYTEQPAQGLAAARMMAMSFYRSWASFDDRFGRQTDQTNFEIVNYLRYHGEKFIDRFDANTYITLTHAMDRHDVGRGENYDEILKRIHQPALIVSISSDVLYPPVEQEELASLIPDATLVMLQSPHGHDAFLMDMTELNDLIAQFRDLLDRTQLQSSNSQHCLI
ncbi:homoserine O-acetyltransferase [Pseudanabaenaceae cyanobacterium LEGE 13415]|nr:homoserine O-acetyltransferase [Pseudanabaenaceae cyanobacterium LEGE 13415]